MAIVFSGMKQIENMTKFRKKVEKVKKDKKNLISNFGKLDNEITKP